MATLFDNVKNTAERRGYTLAELARRADIGEKSIYSWKPTSKFPNGVTPRRKTLDKIADVLGVSVDHLLGNTDDMHANKKDESTVDLIAAHWDIDLDNLSKEEKAIVMARARDYVKGLVDAFESK